MFKIRPKKKRKKRERRKALRKGKTRARGGFGERRDGEDDDEECGDAVADLPAILLVTLKSP